MWPGTLCRGPLCLIEGKLLGGPGAMGVAARLVLGIMLGQFKAFRLRYIRHIGLGFCQLGVEGLPTGLLPLHQEPAFQGLLDRLD